VNRAQALIDDLLENLDDEEAKIETDVSDKDNADAKKGFFPKDAKTVKSDDEDEEEDKDEEPDPYDKIDISTALIAPEATPGWDTAAEKKEEEGEEEGEDEEGEEKEDEKEDEDKEESPKEGEPLKASADKETDPVRKQVLKHADAVSTILGKVSESLAKHKAAINADKETERKIMERMMTKPASTATATPDSNQPAWRRYIKP
jgi:hypothetical protein